MAYSDISILAKLHSEIYVYPFNREDLGSASYDVRLGRYYYEANKPRGTGPHFYNMYSQADIDKVWGNFKVATPAVEYKRRYQYADWANIHDDDLVILLAPRANLLCHTIEFIGARSHATTMMKARSSIGRSLVNVCQCAGMGDVGFANRWAMEIYNRDEWHIPLVVGRRIAQIVFLSTGPTDKIYAGKYQDTNDMEEMMKRWKPEDLLPKLPQDRDVRDRYIEIV